MTMKRDIVRRRRGGACRSSCCCWRRRRRGRAADRHHPRQGRADADRDPGLSGGGGEGAPGRRATSPASSPRSAELRAVPAARSAQLHPERRRPATPPRFGDWRQINAQALVTGSVQTAGRRPAAGSSSACGTSSPSSSSPASPIRRPSRTGAASPTSSPTRSTSGSPARTAISTPASSTSPSPGRRRQRVKRLAIMDQDGANNQYLTDGRALVLTPRFSPSAQEITYLSYAQRHAAGLSVQHRYRAAGIGRRLSRA